MTAGVEPGDYVNVRNVPYKGATGHVVRVYRSPAYLWRRTYEVHLDGQLWTSGKRVKVTNVRKIDDCEQALMRGEKADAKTTARDWRAVGDKPKWMK